MPQGQEMLPEIKNWLKKILLSAMYQGISLSGPDCKKQVERLYPKSHYTVRTYEKWIPKLTPEVIAIYNGLLDQEWSLGIMNLYSGLPQILPEAVPYILRIKELQKPSNNLLIGMKVSVRQARWISYIFTFMNDDISLLDDISFGYALAELNYELKEPKPLYFDTSEYDIYLPDKGIELRKIVLKYFDYDWILLKGMYKRLTGYSLNEAANKILFRDDKAYAIRKHEPDVEIGDRKEIYEMHKRQNDIFKEFHHPSGDVLVQTRIPMLFEDGYVKKHEVGKLDLKGLGVKKS